MSDVVFLCPHCGQEVSCAPEGAGQQVPCPACQNLITVPAAPPPPPPKPGARIAAPATVPQANAAAAPTAPPRPPAPSPAAGAAKKSNGLAVASLVLSLLAPLGSIPAIICGHMAKARIKRDPALGGQGLATAGLVLGYGFLGLSVIGGVLLLTVFSSLLDQVKQDMDKLAADTNKTVAVVTGTPAPTPPKTSKPAKSGKKTETSAPKPAAPEPTPAAADDQVAAVEKVLRTFVAANQKNDRNTVRSLLTTKARKNLSMIIPTVPPDPDVEVLFRIEKTEVDGEQASSVLRVKAGDTVMSTRCRLKLEEQQWRIYALTMLMDRDEPAITMDLEQGQPPIIEADQVKLAAYLAKLNTLAQKSSKSSTKTGKTTKAPSPPPTRPTVEPTPPKPEPAPEPVVALDFGKHRRPADVELVEFAGPTRAVKARVVNHANKPIRKLNVMIYFLDAGASPLGEKFGSLLNPDPHIVAQGDTAEIVFPGVAAPAEAQKAVIEVREVQFKDGTSWKPQ